MKKILYIDMDGVVADFELAMANLDPSLYIGDGDNFEERSKRVSELCHGNKTIFQELEPIQGSIETVNLLFDQFDVYFLSTPMWSLPESYSGKRIWLEKHFGDKVADRLILTKRKDLNIGHYLIDDTTRNGAGSFKGKHIHFGSSEFPNWESVLKFLLNEIK